MAYAIADNHSWSFDAFRLHRPEASLCHDRNSERIRAVKRHVADDNYFGTLATIADLLGQASLELASRAAAIERAVRKNADRLAAVKDDLVYLQKHFAVVERPRTDDPARIKKRSAVGRSDQSPGVTRAKADKV